MKKTGLRIAGIASALLLAACSSPTPGATTAGTTGGTAAAKTYKIGITQIVAHPSLDASREGFKKAIADAGLKVTYDEQNANGDQATATSIASKFKDGGLDLVLAIATPSAQATAQAITSTPILFTAVTDPVAAKLVASNEAPGGNVSGTTDMNPVAEQIALIKKIKPDAKSVGIIYSSGEVNSAVQVKLARETAQKEGLTTQEATITNSSEVQQAAATLTGCSAIYVPTDNAVVSALPSVIQVAEDHKIPLIVGEALNLPAGPCRWSARSRYPVREKRSDSRKAPTLKPVTTLWSATKAVCKSVLRTNPLFRSAQTVN